MKPYILTFVSICFSASMYAQVWVQRTNIPTAKSVVTGMSSGNKGYIVFGRSSTASNSNTLYEYDPILNS